MRNFQEIFNDEILMMKGYEYIPIPKSFRNKENNFLLLKLNSTTDFFSFCIPTLFPKIIMSIMGFLPIALCFTLCIQSAPYQDIPTVDPCEWITEIHQQQNEHSQQHKWLVEEKIPWIIKS